MDSSQTPQHLCRSRDDDVIVSEQLRVGRRAESVSSRLTLCPQRRRPAPKVEMGTSSHNDVDLSWIPQETLNQISRAPLLLSLPLSPSVSLLLLEVDPHDEYLKASKRLQRFCREHKDIK